MQGISFFLSCRPWKSLNTLGKLLELITSLTFLKVIRMVTYLFLLWFVTYLKWLTLFHATRKSLLKSQHVYLSIIVIDYMVFLKLLSPIEILSLLESSGKVFLGKLNTKLNMSPVRHPRTNCLMGKVSHTMQTLLRCYCAESSFDWTSHSNMVEFYCNC